MTIAITLKVNDGVVLAADSASTMVLSDAAGNIQQNVYDHADKLFNLRKGSPIGVVCYGMGNIGPASLATLMKDLRRRFSTAGSDWHLDPEGYSVEWVAEKLQAFIHGESYRPFLESLKMPEDQWPFLGLLVAGYSAGASLPEVWSVDMGLGVVKRTLLAAQPVSSINWGGQTEAISRLILGHDPRVAELMAAELAAPIQQVKDALKRVQAQIEPTILPASIPIQDAIDLAQFLVDVATKYSRYTPGYQSVGGPCDVAAITKHEGFRWVRRKHYYNSTLNPEAR